MTMKAPITPLAISLVQGAADAFVQGSVVSGLSGRQAYRLAGIAFEFNSATTLAALGDALNGTNSDIVLTVTRRSKTASPNYSDSDLIFKKALAFSITTSGATIFEASGYWKPDQEIPIVEETIYAQLDSTSVGIVVTAIARLDVELDSISDLDRLNLITRSLS